MVHLTSNSFLMLAMFATAAATNSTTPEAQEATLTTTTTSTTVTTDRASNTSTVSTNFKTDNVSNTSTASTKTTDQVSNTTEIPMVNFNNTTPEPLKSEATIPTSDRRPRPHSGYNTQDWIAHKRAKQKREQKREKKNKKQRSKVVEEPKHRHGHKRKSFEAERDPVVEKSCPECERKRQREQLEMNRKMSLKRHIMDKLQIDPTKNFKRPVIPQEILRQSLMEDESDFDDEGDAKTTDILVFGRDITNRCRYRKSTACFKFNLRRKIKGYITSAELYVYKLHDPNDGQQTIFLQELERPKHRKLMPRNIVNRVETDITEGWMTFRLDKTVMRWAKEPLANDGIAVKCKTCAGKSHTQLFSSKEGYRTFLVVHIQPVTQRRRQRRSIDCGDVVNSCCKHDFWVDFEDINLAQVIHPKGLWANYCTGPCGPLVAGHYNHTSLLQDVRWRSESANNTIRNAITPCCGAVRLKTISLLYVNDEGDISRADVPNLQLAECGCL